VKKKEDSDGYVEDEHFAYTETGTNRPRDRSTEVRKNSSESKKGKEKARGEEGPPIVA